MRAFHVIKGLLSDEAADGQRGIVLVKFIGAHLFFLLKNAFEFSWINGVKLYAVKYRQSSTACYYYGYYDPMEMHFAKNYIKDGDVFADVGSNIGSWALFAASCGAEAYAIEPTPSTFELLMKNVSINHSIKEKVIPINSAVGDTKGELLFVVDRDSENRVVTAEEAKGMETLSVPCDTLDNICRKKVEIVKIDVENYEIPVLRGSNMLSTGNPNVIIIEAFDNYNDIKKLLYEYGYSQYKYDYKKNMLLKDEGRSQGNNVLFIKDVNKVIDRVGCKADLL